jgi:protein-disulfide isomerase
VAEINGTTVTWAELEQQRADNLYAARRQYYQAERKALDDLVDQRLLELQARKENVTVAELLKRHVDSQVAKDPTDEELKIIYDASGSTEPFEKVRSELIEQIRQLRLAKASTAYAKELRAEAKLSITLPEPRVKLDLNGVAFRGPKDAPVVVVEFADYQCPYCKQIEPQLEKLKSEYGDKVTFAFKDFPLPNHTHAGKLAEAADCAGVQGKFWNFHDYLFNDMKDFDMAQIKEHARSLGMNGAAFDSCVDSDGEATKIKQDQTEGTHLGITGTPTLFINGRYLSGAAKYETIRDMVQEELAASSTQSRQTTAQR